MTACPENGGEGEGGRAALGSAGCGSSSGVGGGM